MTDQSRRLVAFISFLLLVSLNGWAQGAKVRAESVETDQDRQTEMDNVRDREQWFQANRTVPGERSAELLRRAYQQKQQLRTAQDLIGSASSFRGASSSIGKAAQASNPVTLSSPGLGTLGNSWQELGPGPMISDPSGSQDYGKVDGRLTSVAVDQGDPTGNTVYVGAAFGGVWKSINAAASDPNAVTWTPLLDQQPTLAVGAITIQPGTKGDTAVLLVGTGEPNSSGDSYYGMGVLRSTDGGSTWAPIIRGADCLSGNTGCQESFAGLGFGSFAFSTADTNRVVAGTTATNGASRNAESQNPASNRGIYYSQDAGATWKYANVTDGAQTITPASTSSVIYNGGKFFAAVRFHGIYSSSDGAAWTRLPNQPGNGLTAENCPPLVPDPSASLCPIVRGQIAVNPANGEMYVIYVDKNEINQGIYRTADGGNNWTRIAATGTCNTAGQTCHNIGSTTNQVSDLGIEDTASSHELVQAAYDLWIAAVPNGSDTDLMVATRNVYKCTITASNPTCTSSNTNAFVWKNLTHVYDCNPTAAPAHVHPDQHGFDFLAANPAIMYFANDGGVYRSVNRAANDGSCNTQLSFQNLNSNLGSISEFVSFSQDRNDVNTVLGGLQDNGSPAIAPGLAASPLWIAVNNGDGGYNEIDPNNSSIWYTTNTRVSLQQCTSAPNCNFATFGLPPNFTGPNIGSTQVSGDTAEFYMPFTLDLAQTSNVVLGTCRVWRGPGSGGSAWSAANAISPMFDAHLPAAPSCTSPGSGGQTQIRALAVGGPAPNGASQVIYAGLDGNGQIPGHVWATFNADANPPTWTDVTGIINTTVPEPDGTALHFGISDIWIDKIDSTGRTAYVTIQGFGVPHLYRTTNGGGSWTDISAGLPDAPANTVIIDQDDKNTIYLGTDVGAFIGKADPGTGAVTWSNFGTGLPNVPVTRLRLFESAVAGAKLVRASTYGRGVWQISLGPDYVLSVPTIASTVEATTPAPTATFSGLLIPFNGYGATVNLSCDKTAAGTLAASLTCTGDGNFNPAIPGTPFSFTASAGKIATYNFAIQAKGTDTQLTNHLQVLALNVISPFSISASPASATVVKGNTANYTINLNATPDSLGTFGGAVSLSCSAGLPQATTCSFSQPTVTLSGAVTPLTLTIGTRTSQVNAFKSTLPLQFYAGIFPMFGFLLIGAGRTSFRRSKLLVLGMLIVASTIFAVGCGGGGSHTAPPAPQPNTGTPSGTFTITVLALSGNVQHTTQVTLTVQ